MTNGSSSTQKLGGTAGVNQAESETRVRCLTECVFVTLDRDEFIEILKSVDSRENDR